MTLVPSRADRVGLPLRSVEWTDWAAGVGKIGFAMGRYDGAGRRFSVGLDVRRVDGFFGPGSDALVSWVSNLLRMGRHGNEGGLP